MKSLASPLIWRGILAILVGVIAVAWSGITVAILVILFAVYAFLAAGIQAMRALGSETAGPVAGRLALSIVDLAAAVVALAWPGITALSCSWSRRGPASPARRRLPSPSTSAQTPVNVL
jgi:uncharacterized membrane protein HdeD (DUF308 family)